MKSNPFIVGAAIIVILGLSKALNTDNLIKESPSPTHMNLIETWCPPHRVDNLKKLMRRVERAAKRRDVPFQYAISEPVMTEYDFEDLPVVDKYGHKLRTHDVKSGKKFGEKYMRKVIGKNARDVGFRFDKLKDKWVRTESSVVVNHGDFSPSEWTPLAILEKAEGSERVLVRKMPTVKKDILEHIPAKWEGNCDHCGHKRLRKSTALVESKDGEVREVGTSCLFDYTGIDPVLLTSLYAAMEGISRYPPPWNEDDWAAYMDYLAEMGYGGGGRPVSPEWPLTHFLVVCHRLFGVQGAYIKGMGRDILNSRVVKKGEQYYIYQEDKGSYLEILPPSEEHYEVADEIITYILNTKVKSDFDYNLQTVAQGEIVTKKNAGLAAAMWFVWNRAKEQGRLERMFNPPEVTGEYLGKVGERIEFDGIVTRKMSRESYYGLTTMFVFATKEGDEVIWWSSSKKKDLPEVGDEVHVKGRVKKHGEFNDKKNTTISRPNIKKA